MNMNAIDESVAGCGTEWLDILDLPSDVLVLILSLLCGQDIARCKRICRCFLDVILSNLYLQYAIDLARNGMVDSESSILPIFERLQRLREYSSDFERGAFQHQDLTTHPDYVRFQMLNLEWPLQFPISTKCASGALYRNIYDIDKAILFLSLSVPGSERAGIPPSRSLFTIHPTVRPDLIVTGWAMDDAQDLFIIADVAHMFAYEPVQPRTNLPEGHIRFYSLSALKTDTVIPHPAATLAFIRLPIQDSAILQNVFQLQVFGDYVILEIRVDIGPTSTHFIDIYSWKSGQLISRSDIGSSAVSIIPLDEPYLLLFPFFNPRTRTPKPLPALHIFNFLPASSNSDPCGAGRDVCTLQLPPLQRGEGMEWPEPQTGDRAEEITGHFRADLSRSIVALTLYVYKVHRDDEDEYATHLLIPRATLAAQIRAAESRLGTRDSDRDISRPEETTEQPHSTLTQPLSVPWADWGPRGCLCLRLRHPHFQRRLSQIPFGSRMPVVVFDEPSPEHERERESTASVYIFDINPLVARSVHAALSCDSDESDPKPQSATAASDSDDPDRDGPPQAGRAMAPGVVRDIEEVLPGVVDPECAAAVPYVAYRFPLPLPIRSSSIGGGGGAGASLASRIRQVTMGMAGFTVEFVGQGARAEMPQTWTV